MGEIDNWRPMWMMVMFDLPTKEPEQKSAYRKFQNFLLNEGFSMVQYSVYSRHCHSRQIAKSKAARIRRALPSLGQIRILRITETQFSRMEIFENCAKKSNEKAPMTLEFW